MALLADALQPFIVRGFISLGGHISGFGISDVITEETKKGYDIDFNDVSQIISIDFREENIVTPAIAVDCCRFSTAAFQSIISTPTDILHKSSSPWGFIKLYYSAFYAGHALLRIFGESCSYLERRHVRRLNEMGEATGKVPSFQIDGGLYHFDLLPLGSGIAIKKARGIVGGAHESFWDLFGIMLDRISNKVLEGSLSPADAASVSTKLGSCVTALRSSGCRASNRLSEIRNELQYRQGLGVWLPPQIPKRDKEQLSRTCGYWNKDPMEIAISSTQQGALFEFASTCIFIVSLCREMLVRIAERSSVGSRCFVRMGPMAHFRDGEFLWQ